MEPNYTLPQQINDWTNGVFNNLGMQRMVPDTMDIVEEPILQTVDVEEQRRIERQILVRQQMEQVGFAWHGYAAANNSTVGVRPETGPGGRYTNVRIAGRPAPKHGGSQGQHTTAFCANREAVASVIVGRTEQTAREDLAYLFECLGRLPAMLDPSQPVPDHVLNDIAAYSNPQNTAHISVSDIAVYYLELRDAIPGASLNTGINGLTDTSGRANIVGKGEGAHLKPLREAETHAMGNGTFTQQDVTAIAETLCKLYDDKSEVNLPPEAVPNQRVTFLMTVAQAFPELLKNDDVRQAVLNAVTQGLTQEHATYATQQVEGIANRLAGRNELKQRPKPAAFAASIHDGRIDFDARPDSIKDGGSMGDHTTAMQLMKNAATKVLLPRGAETTNGDLKASLKAVKADFSLEHFSFIPQPDGEIDGASLAAPYQERLKATAKNLEVIDACIAALEVSNGDDVPDVEFLLECAEAYLQLMDDRPTAVVYGGLAEGSGEGTTVGLLDEIESGQRQVSNPRELFEIALGMFDSRSASRGAAMFGGDDYLFRVGQEFMFFLKSAYPNIAAALEEAAGEGGVVPFIMEHVEQVGGLGKKDTEYAEEKVTDVPEFTMSLRPRKPKNYSDF